MEKKNKEKFDEVALGSEGGGKWNRNFQDLIFRRRSVFRYVRVESKRQRSCECSWWLGDSWKDFLQQMQHKYARYVDVGFDEQDVATLELHPEAKFTTLCIGGFKGGGVRSPFQM